MATLQQLITKVERLIAQSAGTAVQTYAEPRIAQHLQDSFNGLFLKVWWPQFMTWETLALNGSTGEPSSVPAVRRFVDIRAIFRADSNRRLPLPPGDSNPLLYTGTDPLFAEGITGDRVFRVWPFTATGSVVVNGRVKPNDFALTNDVDMDDTLLSLLAAWQYVVDDGNNPAQAEKLQQLFNTQLELVTHNLQNLGMALDYRYADTVNQWMEYP